MDCKGTLDGLPHYQGSSSFGFAQSCWQVRVQALSLSALTRLQAVRRAQQQVHPMEAPHVQVTYLQQSVMQPLAPSLASLVSIQRLYVTLSGLAVPNTLFWEGVVSRTSATKAGATPTEALLESGLRQL